MQLNVLLTFFLLFVFGAHCLKTCAQKKFRGADNPMVCVCNSTYCDEFPPLGQLQSGKAAVYTSSQSGKRFERTNETFNIDEIATAIELTVDVSKTFQQIIGFGGAFTDAASFNFFNLSQNTRLNLAQAYFGNEGIGYTMGRVPLGSCDFSLRYFNYDNVEGDFNLTNFALAPEDFNYKIPFIKSALSLSNLKLFSSPWAAPTWMKTNKSIPGYWTLKGEVGGPYYQTWANYFIRFFEEYAKQGIEFWGLTVQNEPNSGQVGDEEMHYTPEMERDFVKLNLGPALKANSLTQNLKLMIMDANTDNLPNFPNIVLVDNNAANYVDGIAIHWYNDRNNGSELLLSFIHQEYPSKFLLYTEACTGCCGEVPSGPVYGDWSRGDSYAHDIIQDLNNWATGWVDWNLCLNMGGGPNWQNNYVDAAIIVNAAVDEFYKNPMYYALGHFSKFITENSLRVQLDTKGITGSINLEATAFLTPTNQRVLVINNRDVTSNYAITVNDAGIQGEHLTLSIEPRSFTTIIWDAPN